jgi:GT2 family glycosyltransferase
MQNKTQITASIVLYNEDFNELSNSVDSFLKTDLRKKLFLIDNSPQNDLREKFVHPEIEYIHTKKNIGFGAGHNKIINKIKNYSTYHLILNPDVSFKPSVIPKLIEELKKEKDVSMIAPKVLFSNGDHQYTCRRYPSLLELLTRSSAVFKYFFSSVIHKGEYYDKDLTKSFYPDFMHGGFLLFKTEDFVSINGFDERYFLYMEDVDICRKIDAFGKKKRYFPKEEIIHILKKGSSKNLKLFFIHLISIMKYFNKWGFKK